MGDALKLGIIPKELLLEADRQGYNYSKDDYHFILSGFKERLSYTQVVLLLERGYYMTRLVSMVVMVLVNQF